MYKRKNHAKYSLKVHLIFVVKYRKELITPEISFFIKTIFARVADRSGFRIELMETGEDHIHLLIEYEPKLSILQIVRRLKQESSVSLWKIHKNFLKTHFWKEHTFWSDGYFVCSIGEGASYEVIQKYIKSQG